MSTVKAVLFDAKKNTKKTVILKKEQESPEIKAEPKKVSKARVKLHKFVEDSSDVLYKVKAVFPFDFFPNEIRVDQNQVHVITREFFWSASIASIPIENIIEAVLEMGPFFATLHITDMSFGKNLVTVKYLPREGGSRMRRIIQGLMIVRKQKVDVKPLGRHELVNKLEQLGSASG